MPLHAPAEPPSRQNRAVYIKRLVNNSQSIHRLEAGPTRLTLSKHNCTNHVVHKENSPASITLTFLVVLIVVLAVNALPVALFSRLSTHLACSLCMLISCAIRIGLVLSSLCPIQMLLSRQKWPLVPTQATILCLLSIKDMPDQSIGYHLQTNNSFRLSVPLALLLFLRPHLVVVVVLRHCYLLRCSRGGSGFVRSSTVLLAHIIRPVQPFLEEGKLDV